MTLFRLRVGIAALLLAGAGAIVFAHPVRQRSSAGADSIPVFDGDAAFTYLLKQVAFGPRVPGTEPHERCLAYLTDVFRSLADSVRLQEFEVSHLTLGTLRLTNIVAQFNPTAERRLLLTAHWDSRPWADQDPDPEKRSLGVPGANDGASGAAVLLHLAEIFRHASPPLGVDIVLFDGEDLGSAGLSSSWCLGSKYFASHLPAGAEYVGAVNLDMVGRKGLRIRREANSDKAARALVSTVFDLAATLGIQEFVDEPGSEIYDDHVPLQHARIDAIDLIDFDPEVDGRSTWHTTLDTPDHCSPQSLRAVGTVLRAFIYSFSHTP